MKRTIKQMVAGLFMGTLVVGASVAPPVGFPNETAKAAIVEHIDQYRLVEIEPIDRAESYVIEEIDPGITYTGIVNSDNPVSFRFTRDAIRNSDNMGNVFIIRIEAEDDAQFLFAAMDDSEPGTLEEVYLNYIPSRDFRFYGYEEKPEQIEVPYRFSIISNRDDLDHRFYINIERVSEDLLPTIALENMFPQKNGMYIVPSSKAYDSSVYQLSNSYISSAIFVNDWQMARPEYYEYFENAPDSFYTVRFQNDYGSRSVKFCVDTNAPYINLSGDKVKSNLTKKKVTVTGKTTISAFDGVSGVKSVKLDGKKIKLKKVQSGFKITGKGKHTLKVTDNAGNSRKYTITVK